MAKSSKIYNLLALPSTREEEATVNLADWVELNAILSADANASREDLRKAIQRQEGRGDGDENTSFDERVELVTNSVFEELSDRQRSCGHSNGKALYPFIVDKSHTLLSCKSKSMGRVDMIYYFLLLVSLGDMSSGARTREGVDPTRAFEKLCAEILRQFWGASDVFAGAMIFGTSKRGPEAAKFKSSIDSLCETIGEGSGFKVGAKPPGGGDGKLDLVAWRKFSDKRPGNLLAFVQCKTGKHWEEHLTKLQPRSFYGAYFASGLLVEPVRMYMIPVRVATGLWDDRTRNGGLLFDRCRIVQYCPHVNAAVLNDCGKWLNAILKEQRELRKSLVNLFEK